MTDEMRASILAHINMVNVVAPPAGDRGREKMKRYIIVVESGFVFVGDMQPYDKDEHSIRVENAKNIRRFGTTKGIGQLALSGKTKETILDDMGTIHVNTNKILFLIEVDPNVDL